MVGPSPSRRITVLRAIVVGALVLATGACQRADGSADDATAATAEWCDQLDAAMLATAQLDQLTRDDPGIDDALVAVEREMADLSALPTPPDIAADWLTVAAPPTTDETGAVDLGGDRAAAGARVGAWALRTCDLSPTARATLEQRDGG